jgi:hypothetical protein
VLGNLQEKVQKAKVCDESSLMFVQSVASALLLLVWTLASGELREGISHCWQDPQVSLSLLAWAVSNMAGAQGRKGGREGVREGGRAGGREGGRAGGRAGGREGGREGERNI